MPKPLPRHLKKYVVRQDYRRYTPQDQAVWRFVMRQLKSHLSTHAHPCYLDGLKKTGLDSDRIPRISAVDKKLRRFGWGAIPVSGFIPPAAFMEFQSLGYLPIASEIRTAEHIHYTPAPDIIHEAAGHAPIIVDKQYAAYLKQYAQVAAKSIISHEDMGLYEAIRLLSDAKEDPTSTPEQISDLEKKLLDKSKAVTFISEAGQLSRMNWWTAEYGLFGSLKNPKIFGAGLLSSPGEAKSCLRPTVKKIPISVDCVNYGYDITEPQPQLFVTPSFKKLSQVLSQFQNTMSFVKGGLLGLDRAIQAQTVNTVELDTGLQLSGKVNSYKSRQDEVTFFRLAGPTQLSFKNKVLSGHKKSYHRHGYSSPLGLLQNQKKCLSRLDKNELKCKGIAVGKMVHLTFESGIEVQGQLTKILRKAGRNLLFTFKNCSVTLGPEVLFEPSWGTFDMAAGTKVQSVFGGPADRVAYGALDDFTAKKIPKKKISPTDQLMFKLFKDVHKVRQASGKKGSRAHQIRKIWNQFQQHSLGSWLLGLEIIEGYVALEGRDGFSEEMIAHVRSLPLSKNGETALEEGLALLPKN